MTRFANSRRHVRSSAHLNTTKNAYNIDTLTYSRIESNIEQECQLLLKAKYCRRAMPEQDVVNPGQLVQAVSCTQKHTKTTRPRPFIWKSLFTTNGRSDK